MTRHWPPVQIADTPLTPLKETRICRGCGIEFEVPAYPRHRALYCRPTCQKEARRKTQAQSHAQAVTRRLQRKLRHA